MFFMPFFPNETKFNFGFILATEKYYNCGPRTADGVHCNTLVSDYITDIFTNEYKQHSLS